MGQIVSWWLLAPILAFWICAMVGRYWYPYLDVWFAIDRSDGPLFEIRRGPIPHPRLAPDASIREAIGAVLVVGIACYMAFSAGASNTANAVAPLVGSGELDVDLAIVLAGAAIGVGAFTIARRTLDTVGNDLTDLPLLAALIVEVVSATLITFLSVIGIPASLAVSATMCIIGLGWGRATRTVRLSDAVRGEQPDVSVDALAADHQTEVPRMGEEDPDELMERPLFDPAATGRVISLWLLTPSVSALGAFLIFEFTPVLG